MNWGFPTALFALWLVPVIGLLTIRAHVKRRETAKTFVDTAMVSRLMPRFSLARAWLKAVVLMVAIALLIVAAARPRFGTYFEEISARGVDLFVVLDVSRSMLAEDVKPNRLERAKSDVLDLLTKLEGDRVGLIVFAGAAVMKVPLTTDQGFYKMMLEEIDSNSAPRGGTMIGDAIRKALESMEPRVDRDQAIVLITDGDDQDSFPKEAAQEAAERGVRVIAIGLGDVSEGARIPKRNDDGGLTFVQHEGQEIWSKMDEQLLKDIATTTNGAYIPAQTLSYDLGQIYDDQLAKLTQGEINAEKRKRFKERFQWFGGLGLLLLLVEMMIPGYSKPLDSINELTNESVNGLKNGSLEVMS